MLDINIFVEFNVLRLNSSSILFTILLDWISLIFMRFVFFISSIVIKYREEYIYGDKNLNRFILLVVIFVLSIILLIIRPNLISILLGWDGLGLVSYILVIYYQNVKSFNAGILTALTNRIGDAALLISIAWILNYGRWNFICYIKFFNEDFSIKIISLFIILAAITKRAQIPFSSWLPAAIAAPTPVSSLVHSSTLVTAGVYLLIRFSYIFSFNLINFLLFISLLTIFIAGLGANLEFDLKKIIALSTLSQLGLIISILALGRRDLAFFHLLTHALFKALLFICAGMIIHTLNNCQDIRLIGGLIGFMPVTCILFNICNISLCGLPFLSGFYSKDLIVEFISIGYLNILIYFIFYFSIGLTACYRFRLSYYTITGNFNYLSLNFINENRKIILNSISRLVGFVVIIGRILIWLLFSTPYFICLPLLIKLIALILILFGGWVGYEISAFSSYYFHFFIKKYNFSLFLSEIWNIPVISTYGVNFYPLFIGRVYFKYIDQGWREYYGPQGIFLSIKNISQNIQLLSINYFKVYLLLLVISLFIYFVYLFYLDSLCRA